MITVITPVYNGEEYIEETALSVLDQSGADFEYIIVDDGSTDGTASLLKSLRDRHPTQLQVIEQENRGEAAAINHALQLAAGEYVCIVSADDPLMPNHLATVSAAFDGRPDVVVAYPDWLMIDEFGHPIREVRTLPYDPRTLIADFVCLPGPGALIRRAAIDPDGLRNSRYRYVSDYGAWLQLSLKGPFVRVPQVLARYRIHGNQATTTGRGVAMADEIEKVIADFFDDPELPDPIRRLKRRATAFSSYYAGLQMLHQPDVPGRWRMVKSLVLSPPFFVRRRTHRRHPLAVMAVLAYPIPSWMHARLSALVRSSRLFEKDRSST